ncbi:MAG: phage major capsid protein [Bacteroidaceae bacterium]|nr:phage major capsid protein [Bacteroidaceae bacterium]
MLNEKAKTEEMNSLIERADELIATAELETRELTETELAELNDIKSKVTTISETIKTMNEINKTRSTETMEVIKSEQAIEETRSVEELEYRAFDDYLRNNERADMTYGNNGAIIPQTIAKKIVAKVYDISPILAKATRFNVKGNLEIPVYPASGTGLSVGYATEFTDLTGSTGDFTKVELKGFVIGALSLVSKSLINNADFDLVGFVVDRMAYEIAKFIEGQLINGTSQKIAGLSDCTNVKTLTSTSAITGDDLIALQGKVKDIYQDNAIWVMSSATRDYLRALKDSDNRYLLNDDISAPFGKTLLGRPVYVSDNANDIGEGKKVIYYGDMSGLGVKFAEEINIEVLREKYATSHAVGILGFAELDAKTIDNQKIAVLQMGTTPTP